MAHVRKLLAGAGIVGAMLAMTGCGGGGESAAAIRRNPTPELRTLYERPADVRNALALQRNENWRMFWEDWGRVMYVDRPSRLTPEPMTR